MQWLLVLGVVLTTIGGDVLQAREMQTFHRAGMAQTTVAFFRRPLLIASLLWVSLAADTLVFRDGREIRGRLVRVQGDTIEFEDTRSRADARLPAARPLGYVPVAPRYLLLRP